MQATTIEGVGRWRRKRAMETPLAPRQASDRTKRRSLRYSKPAVSLGGAETLLIRRGGLALSHACCERAEERRGDCGLVLEDLGERPSGQHQAHGLGFRDDGRRPRGAVEQRHLAEVGARAELDLGAPAAADGRAAVEDDVERLARIAGADDRRLRVEAGDDGQTRDRSQVTRRHAGEERHVSEQVRQQTGSLGRLLRGRLAGRARLPRHCHAGCGRHRAPTLHAERAIRSAQGRRERYSYEAMGKLRLHWLPGTAAMAPHAALAEIGVEYELVRVQRDESGQSSPEYLALNPSGRVPTLEDGELVLTEAAAELREHFTRLEAQLEGRAWLVGEHRTAADLFLFMLTRWGRRLDPPAWDAANLRAHFLRTLALPGVRRMVDEQGLELPAWSSDSPPRHD